MNKRLLLFLGLGFSQLLASCVVYMPMQCAAPQINDRQQGEITGSSYLNGRVEIAGTYSPVRHLLVRATYSNLSDSPKDSIFYRGRQYDLGLGTYWQLTPRFLVGGLGGFGQARSEAAYSNGGFFSQPVRYRFDANYNKTFGEVYGIFQANRIFSCGAAYRVTQVNFTSLTDQQMPVDLRSMTRSEPMTFFRARLGRGPVEDRPIQLQVAVGLSTSFGYNENDPDVPRGPVYELKQGRGYTTIGVTIFPHCLFRSSSSAETLH